MRKGKEWYKKDKIIYPVLGIAAAIILLIVFSGSVFSEKNLQLTDMKWDIGGDMSSICQPCLVSEVDCLYPVTYNIVIEGIDHQYLADQSKELQCKVIVDGVDLWRDEGKYFCDLRGESHSWFMADIREEHKVQVCCGTNGLDFDPSLSTKGQPSFACKEAILKALCT